MADERWIPKTEELLRKVLLEHGDPVEDPDGLALRCPCGDWAMLFRNSLGQSAPLAHGRHVVRVMLDALADAGLLLPPGGEMCGCGVPLASHVCTHCHDDPPRGHACPRCGLFTPWRPVDPEEAQP